MSNQMAVVVTSISGPNPSLKALAEGARVHRLNFIVVGDTKSPADFSLQGCDLYVVPRQEQTAFSYAKLCPTRSYGRKNIGYLLAMVGRAPQILETDDDNIPRDAFWNDRQLNVEGQRLERTYAWIYDQMRQESLVSS